MREWRACSEGGRPRPSHRLNGLLCDPCRRTWSASTCDKHACTCYMYRAHMLHVSCMILDAGPGPSCVCVEGLGDLLANGSTGANGRQRLRRLERGGAAGALRPPGLLRNPRRRPPPLARGLGLCVTGLWRDTGVSCASVTAGCQAPAASIIYVYIYIYTHTHIHTYIHTYIHTHIHTHIYVMYIHPHTSLLCPHGTRLPTTLVHTFHTYPYYYTRVHMTRLVPRGRPPRPPHTLRPPISNTLPRRRPTPPARRLGLSLAYRLPGGRSVASASLCRLPILG